MRNFLQRVQQSLSQRVGILRPFYSTHFMNTSAATCNFQFRPSSLICSILSYPTSLSFFIHVLYRMQFILPYLSCSIQSCKRYLSISLIRNLYNSAFSNAIIEMGFYKLQSDNCLLSRTLRKYRTTYLHRE